MALGLASCDALEFGPESSITDGNFWLNADQFNAFQQGLYSQFRGLSGNFWTLGEPRADYFTGETAILGGESGNEVCPLNNLRSTDAGVGNYAGAYSVINQINLMIYNTENTKLLDDAKKASYLADCYGMRAYIYFQLLRSWGDVIITTKPTLSIDPSTLARKQDSAADVLKQIKEDIATSEKYYGNDFAVNNRVFWNHAATEMLKGEVYLWSGKAMGGGNADYQTALTALKSVTATGNYELIDDFESVFAYNNKKNKEIIFAYPTVIVNGSNEYATLGGYIGSYFTMQSTYYNQFCTADGTNLKETIWSEFNGLIRYDLKPSLYEGLYNAEDSRRDATLFPVYLMTNGTPVYKTAVQCKFKGTLVAGNSTRTFADDYPVYRYSDCLLLQAFAKALMGESPADEINAVRKRAYGANWDATKYAYGNDNVSSAYVDADNAGAVEAVLKERAREFFLEGKRWYDLRLAGDAYVYAHSKAQQGKLLWPIDTSTLTANPKLQQTPGY